MKTRRRCQHLGEFFSELTSDLFLAKDSNEERILFIYTKMRRVKRESPNDANLASNDYPITKNKTTLRRS